MNPKRFLIVGGAILVTIGALGVTRLLGRISGAGFFNPPYWINWLHLSLGMFLLIVAFSPLSTLQRRVTLLAAVMGITVGLFGLVVSLFVGGNTNIRELADPSDHLAHLAVGLLALWGWRNREYTSAGVHAVGSQR